MCAAGPEALKAFTGLCYLKRDVLHLFIKLSFIRLSGCVSLIGRLKHDLSRQRKSSVLVVWCCKVKLTGLHSCTGCLTEKCVFYEEVLRGGTFSYLDLTLNVLRAG